jgi:hypothetical protein
MCTDRQIASSWTSIGVRQNLSASALAKCAKPMAADHPSDHLNTSQGLTTAQARSRRAKEGTSKVAQGTLQTAWQHLHDM